MDPLYRGTADRPRVRGLYPGGDPPRTQDERAAELSGHLYGRAALFAADPIEHGKRADQESRPEIPGQRALFDMPRKAVAPRSAGRKVRRVGHRRNIRAAPEASA